MEVVHQKGQRGSDTTERTLEEEDNVTIDPIKSAGELVYERLAALFNECLPQSKVSIKWDKAIIILLHKGTYQTTIQSVFSTASISYSQSSRTALHKLWMKTNQENKLASEKASPQSIIYTQSTN